MAVGKLRLDLAVFKLVDFGTIRSRGVTGARFDVQVTNSTVRQRLFQIAVKQVYNGVTVGKNLLQIPG